MSTKSSLDPGTRRSVRCVVVMPLGPADDPTDTVESVLAYLGPAVLVLVVDDTGRADAAARLRALDDRVVVLPAGKHPGARGALWLKLAEAYRWVCENVDFQVLLRLDADALVIGPLPEDDALRAFAADVGAGMLGSHRVDCNGDPRDFEPAARCLRFESGPLGWVRPQRRSALRVVLASARRHGYQDGEHCLGGALFQSASCIRTMHDRGWLDLQARRRSNLSEDHLFALLTRAAGYSIGDLATADRLLGVRWRGLPCSPEELLARGKKVVHSVRFWNDQDEVRIRAFFRAQRQTNEEERGAGDAS